MKLDEIKTRLKKRNIAACARDTGIGYKTITSIVRGATVAPKRETLDKLIKWIEEN